MNSLIAWLTNHDGYMPHGHCYLWQPSVLWLHVVANGLIAAAYIAIPIVLYILTHRRRHELPYWWVPVLFALFIFLCGLTHLSNIWVIWNTDYRLDGLLKLVTGIVSVLTAIAIAWITPKALLLQTPTQLQRIVDARTEELSGANAKLRDALAENERVTSALRVSEMRYRFATEALQGYVYEIDAGSGVAVVTRGFGTLLGRPSDVPVPIEQWSAMLHPDDRERVEQAWLHAKARGDETASCKYRLRAGNGRYVWVWDHAHFVYDSTGRIRQVIGNVLDVTAQEHARLAAAESERKFRQIASAMPDIVFVLGPDLAVEYINLRWEEKTGLATADAASMRAAVLPEDWPALAEAWSVARRSRQPIAHEFRMRHARTGEARWFLIRARAVEADDGTVARWIGSTTDIDDQKRAQQVLADADRRKNEFLATLAHELRNPLAPVRYAVHVLKANPPPEAAEQAREMISRQLAHMARLLDDLLDVSRVSRGRMELRPALVDLRDVVRFAADAAGPSVSAARQTITVHVPERAVVVRGDQTRLAQVLDNLLNNACRYTEAGGRIAVTLDFRGATARVRVQDSGIGLGGAELERIFDLFTQVERTGRTRSGLGIGLALSRQIAELHGGTLQAESEGHDKGSTFTLTLPLSESPEVADGSGADAMAMRASELPRRVLVVDDNADAADGLAMVLRMRGIETRTAYDGMEATVVARQMQPDAVLLDLGMPQLDGLGLARWIRQQSWERRPWLVAITGWGQAADRARSTEAGIDLHLTKPVDADALLGELARLAGGVERSP